MELFINENNKGSLTDRYTKCYFLMPNGQVIILEINNDSFFDEIKVEVFKEAKKYPVYSLLKESKFYIFSYVSLFSTIQVLKISEEGTKRLVNLGTLYKPVFKLTSCDSEDIELYVRSQIEVLTGIESPITRIDASIEEKKFIVKYKEMVEALARKRDEEPWEKRLPFAYPPDIDDAPDIPFYIEKLLLPGNKLKLEYVHNKSTKSQLYVDAVDKPSEIVLKISQMLKAKLIDDIDPSEYILRVVGQQNYFIKDYDNKNDKLIEYPIIRYKFIRDSLSINTIPKVTVTKKTDIQLHYSPIVSKKVTDDIYEKLVIDINQIKYDTIDIWSFPPNSEYTLTINSAYSLDYADRYFGVEAALYVGKEQIGQSVRTEIKQGPNPRWQEKLNFGISICCLPRFARICLALFSLPKASKKIKHADPIGWLNIPIFNYHGVIEAKDKSNIEGYDEYSLWPYQESQQGSLLNPLGTVSKYQERENSVYLNVNLMKFDKSVAAPTMKNYLHAIDLISKQDETIINQDLGEDLALFFNKKTAKGNQLDKVTINSLQKICKKNPIEVLNQKEKTLIWCNWMECKSLMPEMLPKLLNTIRWDLKEHVAIAMYLVHDWPIINFEDALQLLDFAYPDREVRSYAVKCLENMTNLDLEYYLLQIVQALKFETYYDCDLVEFLLKRAMRNRRIAHFLFWNLKSEMNTPEVRIRFSLMLEIICRGDFSYCENILRQNEFLKKLEYLSGNMQKLGNLDRNSRKRIFQEYVNIPSNKDLFENLISPLDPRFHMTTLKVENCDVKESKKKPIVIVFTNKDPLGMDIKMLFKYGDDLRQDILTLQTLRVMNRIWQKNGFDLKLCPYKVMSSGFNTGLIEMVEDSTTLGKIQQELGFKRTTIVDWLNNQKNRKVILDTAVDMFKSSCSGYSVATLVLGIGDRHNDNVMLKKNGQMFHIDFGHFLGNFKSFMGIRRERVPFILTRDFIYAATYGSEDDSVIKFKKLQKLCEQVYLILRRKGNLLVTLFALMVNSNLPELNKPDDLKFLVNSLCLNKRDDEALSYFHDRFKEAYNLRWTTYLNFYAHNKKITSTSNQQPTKNAEKKVNEFSLNSAKP